MVVPLAASRRRDCGLRAKRLSVMASQQYTASGVRGGDGEHKPSATALPSGLVISSRQERLSGDAGVEDDALRPRTSRRRVLGPQKRERAASELRCPGRRQEGAAPRVLAPARRETAY